MIRKPISFALLALLLLPSISLAQASQSSAASGQQVTFELRWPEIDPQWYQISVGSDGSASYRWQAKDESGDESDGNLEKFTISPGTRDRIFRLTQQLNHFQGQFADDDPRIAFTGKHTLRFQDESGKTSATSYNYSRNQSVQELGDLFQRIAATLQMEQKLKFQSRFDKLSIEGTLKRMEEMASGQQLAELQVISPLLEKIANDSGVMNIARQRARHLLAMANGKK